MDITEILSDVAAIGYHKHRFQILLLIQSSADVVELDGLGEPRYGVIRLPDLLVQHVQKRLIV